MATEIRCGEKLIGHYRAAQHDPRPVGLKRLNAVYRLGTYRALRYEDEDSIDNDDLIEVDADSRADFDELSLTRSDIRAMRKILRHFDAVGEGGAFVDLLSAILDEMDEHPEVEEFVFTSDFDA